MGVGKRKAACRKFVVISLVVMNGINQIIIIVYWKKIDAEAFLSSDIGVCMCVLI